MRDVRVKCIRFPQTVLAFPIMWSGLLIEQLRVSLVTSWALCAYSVDTIMGSTVISISVDRSVLV